MLDLKVMRNLRPGSLTALARSDAFRGLMIFLLIDLIFRAGFNWNQDKSVHLTFDIPYRSHIWWATKEFLGQPKGSDVVLLGASDMAAAVSGTEATFLNTPIHNLLHHRCSYLASKLQQLDSRYKDAFCLAVGGAMPSDCYFMARTLLLGEHKPKAIVCTIAPRSFCDSQFGDPKSSDVYRVMSKLSGTQDFGLSYLCSFWDRLDYGLQQSVSIYGHKYELASWQHHMLNPILSTLLCEDFSKMRTPRFAKLAALKLSGDSSPSGFISMPFDPKHPVFTNNMADFEGHFSKINFRVFYEQLDFLRKLGDFCRSEGISLVLVNSPVTAENRQLVKPEFYKVYLIQVSSVASKCGAKFVNLDLPEIFKHEDFADTVHLNARGGQKFFDQIAPILARPSKLAAADRLPGRHLQIQP
jgi:hypothetical protein